MKTTLHIGQEIDTNQILIKINSTPFLYLKKSEFIGFSSWIEGHAKKTYKIDVHTHWRDIPLSFSAKDKWEKILKLLSTIEFTPIGE